MDGTRFDCLTKMVAASTSRRQVLRAMAGLTGTGILTTFRRQRVQAAANITPLLHTRAQADTAPNLSVVEAGGATFGHMVGSANSDGDYQALRRYLHQQGFSGGGNPSVYVVSQDGTLLRTVLLAELDQGGESAFLSYGEEADGSSWAYVMVYTGYTIEYGLNIRSDGTVQQAFPGSGSITPSGGVHVLASLQDETPACFDCQAVCSVVVEVGCTVAVGLVVPVLCGPAYLACSMVAKGLAEGWIALMCSHATEIVSCPTVCADTGYCGCDPQTDPTCIPVTPSAG